jgi:hypothetical protein
MLVWPISFTSLVALGWRCYLDRRLLQALPLLASQLISALVWASLAAYEVGLFNNRINGTQILNGSSQSLKNTMIIGFLVNIIYLEPLSLFLYTWQFLSEVEQSFSKPAAKTFLKWFARISILLIPPAFIILVIAYTVENSRYLYYLVLLEPAEFTHYGNIADGLNKAI